MFKRHKDLFILRMRRQKDKSLQLPPQNRQTSGVNSATPKATILHRITPVTPKVLINIRLQI